MISLLLLSEIQERKQFLQPSCFVNFLKLCSAKFKTDAISMGSLTSCINFTPSYLTNQFLARFGASCNTKWLEIGKEGGASHISDVGGGDVNKGVI